MKSKEETDQKILESVSISNNKLEEIRVRHTDSIHPVSCICIICKPLRFEGAILESRENSLKDELDLYNELTI